MSLQPINPYPQFSADPRNPANGQLRANDADRDVLAQALAEAYAAGQLDDAEYAERLEQGMRVKLIGDIAPVISDLVVADAKPAPPPAPAKNRSKAVKGWQTARAITVRSWVGLAVLFNLIWLFTTLGAGHAIYYWPMWPMLGTFIPVMITIIATPSED